MGWEINIDGLWNEFKVLELFLVACDENFSCFRMNNLAEYLWGKHGHCKSAAKYCSRQTFVLDPVLNSGFDGPVLKFYQWMKPPQPLIDHLLRDPREGLRLMPGCCNNLETIRMFCFILLKYAMWYAFFLLLLIASLHYCLVVLLFF